MKKYIEIRDQYPNAHRLHLAFDLAGDCGLEDAAFFALPLTYEEIKEAYEICKKIGVKYWYFYKPSPSVMSDIRLICKPGVPFEECWVKHPNFQKQAAMRINIELF